MYQIIANCNMEFHTKLIGCLYKNFFKFNEPIPVPERVILSNASVYKAIVDYIQKMDPYMLVIGAKGSSNIRNLHVGSNTVHLLEKATCPVLVVPISPY
jgi:nucleotide-binding universal stress UspA family protein